MHFSIPETEECKNNESGKTHTIFKIHINGAHHCSVRYSELCNLNEQLRNEFLKKIHTFPSFPPKKLFQLSNTELNDRRFQLEKYLQLISQDPRLLTSKTFVNFFLNAQKSIQKQLNDLNVQLDIYLLNGDKITLDINPYEQTEDVLEMTCKKLNLEENLVYYFVIRKIQDFESPFISLKEANKNETHKIVLRKSILDNSLEKPLLESNVATSLLHMQAVFELKIGWVMPSDKNIIDKLNEFDEEDKKKEFVELARKQKYYGCVQFKPCTSDYPEKNTQVRILIGNRTLIMKFMDNNNSKRDDISFKVTRIKCWKITNLLEGENLELSFEYLFSKDNLKWIQIKSEQSIIMSMSLQNMVDEIIMCRNGESIKVPADRLLVDKQGPNLNHLVGTNLSLNNKNRTNSNNTQNDVDLYDDTITDGDL